jgi:PAS domain S-box-containing protein
MVRQQASALDSAVDGMAIVDKDGKYSYVNEGYARLMGNVYAKRLSAKPGGPRLRKDAKTSDEEVRKALQKDGKWYGIVECRAGQATYIPVEVALTLLADGGVVVVSRDLSERRQAEQAKQKRKSSTG